MKLIKKAAAAVVAASLALSLSACGTDVSWAAKIGNDVSVPIGMYIYTGGKFQDICAERFAYNLIKVGGADSQGFRFGQKSHRIS